MDMGETIMDDELRYHAPDPALLDRFLDRVRRGDPTDAAFLAEYRGVIRPQIEALPPQDAAAVISHLENALVPQKSAFCAMLLADEAATLLRLGANARALGVLQDACAMSAACRDAQGMVESSFLLARCFAAMNDAPSARRSAALCMRSASRRVSISAVRVSSACMPCLTSMQRASRFAIVASCCISSKAA